jgi:hypothetical protein
MQKVYNFRSRIRANATKFCFSLHFVKIKLIFQLIIEVISDRQRTMMNSLGMAEMNQTDTELKDSGQAEDRGSEPHVHWILLSFCGAALAVLLMKLASW